MMERHLPAVREFESLYTELTIIRSRTFDPFDSNGFDEKVTKLYQLLDKLLIENKVTYHSFLKSELKFLCNTQSIFSSLIPFSSSFLSETYSHRRRRLFFLMRVLYKHRSEVYMVPEILELGKVIAAGDKDLGWGLMLAVFELLNYNQIQSNDVKDMFSLIEKVIDYIDEADTECIFAEDLFGWMGSVVRRYYTSDYYHVIEKGLNHPCEQVREDFIQKKDILITDGKIMS